SSPPDIVHSVRNELLHQISSLEQHVQAGSTVQGKPRVCDGRHARKLDEYLQGQSQRAQQPEGSSWRAGAHPAKGEPGRSADHEGAQDALRHSNRDQALAGMRQAEAKDVLNREEHVRWIQALGAQVGGIHASATSKSPKTAHVAQLEEEVAVMRQQMEQLTKKQCELQVHKLELEQLETNKMGMERSGGVDVSGTALRVRMLEEQVLRSAEDAAAAGAIAHEAHDRLRGLENRVEHILYQTDHDLQVVDGRTESLRGKLKAVQKVAQSAQVRCAALASEVSGAKGHLSPTRQRPSAQQRILSGSSRRRLNKDLHKLEERVAGGKVLPRHSVASDTRRMGGQKGAR
ncbi:hypothetical protein CYMTET_16214, partial [Cymbomonas tetramitiformis]